MTKRLQFSIASLLLCVACASITLCVVKHWRETRLRYLVEVYDALMAKGTVLPATVGRDDRERRSSSYGRSRGRSQRQHGFG